MNLKALIYFISSQENYILHSMTFACKYTLEVIMTERSTLLGLDLLYIYRAGTFETLTPFDQVSSVSI